MADPMPGTEELPEQTSAYFALEQYNPAEVVFVDIAMLQPSHPSAVHTVENAKRFMAAAAAGTFPRRTPIRVTRQLNKEELLIVDGNATYAVAQECGWTFLPCFISGPTA